MRALLLGLALIAFPALADIQLGPRPHYLVDQMPDGSLKDRLTACKGPFRSTPFSIGHRGAALQFPEHSAESYRAAARMGAGIVECDVTFTRDLHLVCRHAQDDLAATTDILVTDLAGKCTRPFRPGQGAECRASDLTLAEFRTLKARMDGVNKHARTARAYMQGTPRWRTELYSGPGTLMSHAGSIRLLRSLGVKFAPELKAPVVRMPFRGLTREAYAQKLIDEYKAAGIPAGDVWPQSFRLDDVLYWISAEPEFGRQAVWLDASYRRPGWSPMRPGTWLYSMAELRAMGVNYVAPPLWVLVTLEDGRIVPSAYAREARAAGLNIITWTVERSNPATGGWYFQSIEGAVGGDGDLFGVIDILARDVGVVGIFSDWPATTTFYANCMGLN